MGRMEKIVKPFLSNTFILNRERRGKEEPNMNKAAEEQVPQISHFVRKLSSSGYPLIGYKDWLWSAGREHTFIKQWNCEGQCIRTLSHTDIIFSLCIWRDHLYSGSYQ